MTCLQVGVVLTIVGSSMTSNWEWSGSHLSSNALRPHMNRTFADIHVQNFQQCLKSASKP